MNPVSQAVKRGLDSVVPGRISEAVHNRAGAIFVETVDELKAARDETQFPRFAESFGFVLGISQMEQNEGNSALSKFFIATLLRQLKWEDVDITKTEGAELFYEVAGMYRRTGEVQNRAISLTNSALSLIEKHRPSSAEREVARRRLELGLSLRELYSEDWAFSKFNLGLYWSTTETTGDDLIQDLTKAKSYINASMKIFGPESSDHLNVALGELARIEERLVSARVEIALADAVASHLDELPDRAQYTASTTPIILGFVLQSNPQSMGLAETPNWVTSAVESQPDVQSSHQIRMLLQRLRELPDGVEASGLTNPNSAAWYRARLEWILDKSLENYNCMVEALGTLSEDGDCELYFIRGMKLLESAQATSSAEISVQLLLSLSAAYSAVYSFRISARVESFLRNHPAEIRFVACELCEHGQFDDAFDLLESTRSILQLQRNDFSQDAVLVDETSFARVVWVYLTHSPKASYVLARTLDEGERRTYGEAVYSIPGARLVQLTSSRAAGHEGILVSQDPLLPASILTRAVANAIGALTPIADAINRAKHDLGGTSIVLIPSGLYSVFPLPALETSEDAPDYRRVPKMVATTMRATLHSCNRPIFSARVLSARVSTGRPELHHADLEAQTIAILLESMFPADAVSLSLSASVADLLGALRSADIVHVSSHSRADHLEPTQSSIALSDGAVTVEDILGSRQINCALVTLSSCQSGLSGPLVLADEFLSLQSALLYSGCRLSIGTLWPIIDIVGLLFFTRFYSALLSDGFASLDFNTVWEALDETRRWMRDSPVSEVIEFCDSHAVIWPLAWSRVPNDTKILSQPSVWAAFYLSGSDARVKSLPPR
jgi:hypothetical protein